jgi:hypothetical protein
VQTRFQRLGIGQGLAAPQTQPGGLIIEGIEPLATGRGVNQGKGGLGSIS